MAVTKPPRSSVAATHPDPLHEIAARHGWDGKVDLLAWLDSQLAEKGPNPAYRTPDGKFDRAAYRRDYMRRKREVKAGAADADQS